jgi:FdhD protein
VPARRDLALEEVADPGPGRESRIGLEFGRFGRRRIGFGRHHGPRRGTSAVDREIGTIIASGNSKERRIAAVAKRKGSIPQYHYHAGKAFRGRPLPCRRPSTYHSRCEAADRKAKSGFHRDEIRPRGTTIFPEASMSHERSPQPADAPRVARPPHAEVARVEVVAGGPEGLRARADWVAVEEPLEIRAGGPGQEPVSVAVTMRTPGRDFELAVGFLRTEGLIDADDRVVAPAEPSSSGLRLGRSCNVVHVPLARPFDCSALKRNFFATSSCGLCGKASLEKVAVRCGTVAPGPVVGRSTLIGLPETLREAQEAFDRTGGLHAAGLFDGAGELIAVREDVGRHNAVDKLVGRAFLDGELPLSGRVLLVSGRTSFEILQKAAVAGVPIVAAVSAPSSLAVSVADRLGITLVGFLRGPSFNVYTHPERIDSLA